MRIAVSIWYSGRRWYVPKSRKVMTDMTEAEQKKALEAIRSRGYTEALHQISERFPLPSFHIERDNHVIDTTILEQDGICYRYSKNESTKRVGCEYAASLKRHRGIPRIWA